MRSGSVRSKGIKVNAPRVTRKSRREVSNTINLPCGRTSIPAPRETLDQWLDRCRPQRQHRNSQWRSFRNAFVRCRTASALPANPGPRADLRRIGKLGAARSPRKRPGVRNSQGSKRSDKNRGDGNRHRVPRGNADMPELTSPVVISSAPNWRREKNHSEL